MKGNSQCKEKYSYLGEINLFLYHKSSCSVLKKQKFIYFSQGRCSQLVISSEFLHYPLDLNLFSFGGLSFYCWLNICSLIVKSNIHFVYNSFPHQNSVPLNKRAVVWSLMYLTLCLSNSKISAPQRQNMK